MQIQMEAIQKMKLYNIYRLCKMYIDSIYAIKYTAKEKDNTYLIEDWIELNNIIITLEKIPVLQNYADGCIEAIPDTVRHKDSFRIDSAVYNNYLNNINILYRKMEDIIELYESLNLENEGNGIDIKLPPCDNLKEYITYLKEIEFIFSQCPFLQCEGEILKFGSVDIGSNWFKLTLATASTCVILNNTAALVDKALVLRSHYITIQQQEELLKSSQIKNELSEEQLEVFKQLKTAGMNTVIHQLEKDIFELSNPEDRDRAERSLEKIILLLDKGCEIYATLDSPDDIQSLFPEIQGNLELPDSLIKYLEEKEELSE